MYCCTASFFCFVMKVLIADVHHMTTHHITPHRKKWRHMATGQEGFLAMAASPFSVLTTTITTNRSQHRFLGRITPCITLTLPYTHTSHLIPLLSCLLDCLLTCMLYCLQLTRALRRPHGPRAIWAIMTFEWTNLPSIAREDHFDFVAIPLVSRSAAVLLQ